MAFQSFASNLVAGDSNGVVDIFVHDFLGGSSGAGSSSNPSASKDIAGSGTTILQSGRILVSVPANAIPSGETNCRIVIQKKGTSADYGFTLDDTVWDVKLVCDSGEVHILFAPISVCIRPTDGVTSNKQVFHKHGSSGFTALPETGERSGYACGQTQTLSLFTLGSLAIPNTGFAPGTVTQLPAQPASQAYVSSDLSLNIPELDLNMDIVGVPQGPNGWDVSWLGNDAGYLYGTAFPTMAGNTVLTAACMERGQHARALCPPGPIAIRRSLQHQCLGAGLHLRSALQQPVFAAQHHALTARGQRLGDLNYLCRLQ